MKWRFETPEEARNRLSEWHPYFAWQPTVLTGRNEKVWLQKIYRKGVRQVHDFGSFWDWHYAENIFEVLKD